MQKPEIVQHPHLDARTVQLGMLAMWICEKLPQRYAGRNVADQLFRSATSVAANYAEASEPESDADFVHKLKVALKELKETRVWLRFAGKLMGAPFIGELEAETVGNARMMGARMRRRGYSGWTNP